MKNIRCLAKCMVLLVLLLASGEANAKRVSVKGYYRKNGTYVAPHTRNVGGSSSYSPSRRKTSSSGSLGKTSVSSGRKYRTTTSTSTGASSGSVSVYPLYGTSTNVARGVTTKKRLPEERQWTEDRLAVIDEEIENYRMRNEGKVPTSLLELLKSSGRIMSFVDGWGCRFSYKPRKSTYVLRSSGADKQFGTEDDIISAGSAVDATSSGR